MRSLDPGRARLVRPMPEPALRNLPTLLVLPAPNVIKSWLLDSQPTAKDPTDQRSGGLRLCDGTADASAE